MMQADRDAAADRYHAAGWWTDATVSDAVRENATRRPDASAYIDHPHNRLSWAEFDRCATALAAQLGGLGVTGGDRVAVWHGDTTALHVLFVAIERRGAVTVGIGARAGANEVSHLLQMTQPRLLIADEQRERLASEVASETSGRSPIPVRILRRRADDLSLGADVEPRPPADSAALGADDVYWINSTSGTTGLPKCVVHTQNRWRYFHQKVIAHAQLTQDDIFMPVIAAPFGFGIWTTHTTPIYLGATTVLLERFTPIATCMAIARHKVSVLCCVSTQLLMLLSDRACRDYDLSSLRVIYTGGEALPFRQAAEFEDLTGATILQFYGSNETGLLSGTKLGDTRERRLRTTGQIVPEMSVRLFDGDRDVTHTGRGQPVCRGPATSLGYLDGTDHDKLFTPDGWMRMGDIGELDADGYLSVAGRISDFIIRGGKNISAAQVEDAVMTHPAIAVAAAVAMPDPVFGEKVCVCVECVSGQTIDLPTLTGHLITQGFSKELLPERLIVLDELPRSSGGKIAKGELRERIRKTLGRDYERA